MKGDLFLVAVVSVKPISQKYSWTEHGTAAHANRQAKSQVASRKRGVHTRLCYKVNVYNKVPLVALTGTMGRAT